MLANLLGGFIVILVGVNLIGPVADQVYTAKFGQNDSDVTNVSGVSATLLDITIIFFAIGVMASGVALSVSGMKNAGMM